MTPGRSPWRRGRRIGDRYELERRIGTGGFAEVWRAHDERLDRPVAVKLLRRDALPDDASRHRLTAEARATAALAHPNIVPVFDVVEDADAIAIVFQLVTGMTLAERLRRDGPLAEAEARRVAIEVASALDSAHRGGLVHLDVKPANVVLDDDGHARLIDFGIARLLADAAPTSRRRTVTGTLRHMAPEQLAGEAVDARTDLYALGLLLVEMLTARPAFDGRNPTEVLAAQRAGPPALDAVPAALRPIVGRLLAPAPTGRPESAREVIDALDALGSMAPTEGIAEGVAAGSLGTATALDEPTVSIASPPTTTFAAAGPVADEAEPVAAPVVPVVASATASRSPSRISPQAAGAIAAVILLAIAGAAVLNAGPGASRGSAASTPAGTAAPAVTTDPAAAGGGAGDGGAGGGGGNNGNHGGNGKGGNGHGGGNGH